ncbi:MAG: acetoacetate--CoA ligase [Thiotrichaceae bacterium]|nr:MAG: acetoacetate--CoA ligase [Thiotrichaceae bacterium]
MPDIKCWQPAEKDIESSQLSNFRHAVNQKHGLRLENYNHLYDWSISEIESFWDMVWIYCDVVASEKGDDVLVQSGHMEAAKFFPQAKLNFAKNLLCKGGADDEALVFIREDGATQRLTYAQLSQQVAALANFLRHSGVVKGDRVAGYLPNINETVVAMLATTSLGAVWSSCSPDFGVQGVLDRFAQIEPKIIFVTDAYFYAGKVFDVMEKNIAIIEQLETVEQVILAPLLNSDISSEIKWNVFSEILSTHAIDDDDEIEYVDVAFNDPLYIMFSSGTTGVPKCIVHGVGGTLLQHLKEHRLHVGLQAKETIYYATTCGWMMWNWLITALASGSRLILYDGALFYPKPEKLFDLIDQESISVFGVSAKYLDALRNKKLSPIDSHDLSSLKTILSTGSPLLPETFDYVYQSIKQKVCLSSISGGTDIVSCFALGCEVLPVYRGELQCRGLGMAVQAWDEQAESVIGKKGELVCVKPFPSMPVAFWHDEGRVKYHAAYFKKYSDVWCHGDYIEITDRGGVLIYGRSDAVLNPGGVRIGTAEIYRQVEQLDEINESLIIGQQWHDDVRLVLFVCLAESVVLDDLLEQKIRQQIRCNTTPRHVPEKIISVPDIPKTRSGKIVELAVRDVVHGETIKNKEALMNPEALDYFKDLSELYT